MICCWILWGCDRPDWEMRGMKRLMKILQGRWVDRDYGHGKEGTIHVVIRDSLGREEKRGLRGYGIDAFIYGYLLPQPWVILNMSSS